MLTSQADGSSSAAQAAGYDLQDGMHYLEKRRLHATAVDDRLEELGGSLALGRPLACDRGDGAREGAHRTPGDPAARGAGRGAASRSRRSVGGDPVRPAGHGQDDVREGDRRTPRMGVRRGVPESARRHRRARAGRRAARDLFDEIEYLDRIVVFIDEVEEIASHRQERPETRVMANELLKLIPTFRERRLAPPRRRHELRTRARPRVHAAGQVRLPPPRRPSRPERPNRHLAAVRRRHHERRDRPRRARGALAVLLRRRHRVRREEGRAGRLRAVARRRPAAGDHLGLPVRHRRGAALDHRRDGPGVRGGHRPLRALLMSHVRRRAAALFRRSRWG